MKYWYILLLLIIISSCIPDRRRDEIIDSVIHTQPSKIDSIEIAEVYQDKEIKKVMKDSVLLNDFMSLLNNTYPDKQRRSSTIKYYECVMHINQNSYYFTCNISIDTDSFIYVLSGRNGYYLATYRNKDLSKLVEFFNKLP